MMSADRSEEMAPWMGFHGGPSTFQPRGGGGGGGRHSFVSDRFIPVRSAMDFDFAHSQLTGWSANSRMAAARPSRHRYQELLAKSLLNNRTRILSFNNKRPKDRDYTSFSLPQRTKQQSLVHHMAENILDAPDLADDFCLNLLDWGSSNVISLALHDLVYLRDASNGSTSLLVSVDEDVGPVTSVSWAPDGIHLAIGLNNSHVQIWDAVCKRPLRTLRGVHRSRVGALAWNNNILTTGGADKIIVNNDMRIESHVIQTYQGHNQEVCGLKWCGSGRQLASGGNDNLVHIWDITMAGNSNQWVHRFSDHKGGVRALAWCPLENNLLASGGGNGDGCIKFWKTSTGACLNSVRTDSPACALLWNKRKMELLSSCGDTGNQLILRNYPSMVKTATLVGHTGRVLYMAQSPDGCTVATASGGADETMRLWKIFPPAPKLSEDGLFSNFMNSQIR